MEDNYVVVELIGDIDDIRQARDNTKVST